MLECEDETVALAANATDMRRSEMGRQQGEHTVQILQEIGFDGPRIESLRQSGVI